MTKYSLSEQVKGILNSSGRDSDLDYQDLMQYIGQTLAYFVEANLFKNIKGGDTEVDGQFIYAFPDIAVKYNSGMNLYYSELPSSYIGLPNGMGVALVCLPQSQDLPFVQVSQNFLSASKGNLISDLEGQYGYWIEGFNKSLPTTGGKIYYTNFGVNVPTTVLVKLIAGVDNIGENDYLSIPSDIQKLIVDAVVERFMNQPPADVINDNKSRPTA